MRKISHRIRGKYCREQRRLLQIEAAPTPGLESQGSSKDWHEPLESFDIDEEIGRLLAERRHARIH